MKERENRRRKKKDTEDILQKHNPVEIYTFPCGCKISGIPPIVNKIMLCDRHRMTYDQIKAYAPFTAKKILEW